MPVQKSFKVLGELVEVFVDARMSNGQIAVMTQTSPPGGGPPPHMHTKEDEAFTVLQGEFEMFDGSAWHPLRPGDVFYAERGRWHTFRNVGQKDGVIQVVACPAGMDEYLEAISHLSMPQDLDQLIRISDAHGITFLPMDVKSS